MTQPCVVYECLPAISDNGLLLVSKTHYLHFHSFTDGMLMQNQMLQRTESDDDSLLTAAELLATRVQVVVLPWKTRKISFVVRTVEASTTTLKQ